MDITPILLACQDPTNKSRDQAEAHLRQLQTQNAPLYLQALARELSDEAKPLLSRSLAGLELKNALTSKDDEQAEVLANHWKQLEEGLRHEIKEASLRALGAGVREVRNTAAQVVSKIATIELPAGMWPQLMPGLLVFVTQAEPTPAGQEKKEATLSCIGFICEEIAELETDVLETQSSSILTAVVAGMRKEEPSVSIKHAAAKALLNALDFVKKNFEVVNERNYIMQVTCDACHASSDPKVKEVAFECLARIADLYYDKLDMYMQAVFELTVSAIRTESDDIAKQAIEFWSTICDKEYDLEKPHYIQGALAHLLPLFLETMTKQGEDPDDDEEEDTKAARASMCVGLIANTIGDDIIGPITPWIHQNIINPDWHFREAAVLALGYVLEGPEDKALHQLVTPLLAPLVGHLKDPARCVRDSTAWTFGRICQHIPIAITPAQVSPLMDTFISCLAPDVNTPKTAKHLCWAINNFAENVIDKVAELAKEPQRNELTERFPNICTALMACSSRGDARSDNLRASSYEALCTVIKSVAPESMEWLYTQLLPQLGSQLTVWVGKTQFLNQDDVNERNEWLSILCGALQDVVSQLDAAKLLVVAEQLMQLFFQVLSGSQGNAHEEALLAIGSVCNGLGKEFEKYAAPVCTTFVVPFLKNWQATEVCGMAIHIIGDMCRALEDRFVVVVEDIMAALVELVANPKVDESIIGTSTFLKPATYEVFGDISLAITGHFNRYLPTVAGFLHQGAALVDSSLRECEGSPDDDQRYFIDSLSESILQAYTGIVQGLKQANDKMPDFANCFLPFVDNVMALLRILALDEHRDITVTKAAAGVIGDMALTFGNKIKPQLSQDFIKKLTTECTKQGSGEISQIGKWAAEQVTKASR